SGTPIAATTPGTNDDVSINHEVTHYLNGTYTHFGDVIITGNGDYHITRRNGGAKKYIFAGDMLNVQGIFRADGDVLLGRDGTNDAPYSFFSASSIIEIGDDLILNAFSSLDLNAGSCTAAGTIDDIYFVGSNGRVCGSGSFIVPDRIRAWNDSGSELFGAALQSAVESQLCSGFGLYGSEGDCNAGTPIITGTGTFVLASRWEVTEMNIRRGQAELEWKLATDENLDHFVVSRSIDAVNYEAVASFEAKGYDQVYRWMDQSKQNGRVYYRIEAVLANGGRFLSNILSHTFVQTEQGFVVYENGQAARLSGLPVDLPFRLMVMDINGAFLAQQYVEADMNGEYSLDQLLPPAFDKQYLILKINFANGKTEQLSLIR
ncbi:MAG: hypothetical protein AAF206_27335, partial [Bacteroidota bacterium]